MTSDVIQLVLIFAVLIFAFFSVRGAAHRMRTIQTRPDQPWRKEYRGHYMSTALIGIFVLAILHATFLLNVSHMTCDVRPEGMPLFLEVLDIMAKGALLDLFESFEIDLSSFTTPDEWSFAYSCVQFICRTGYSVAYFVIGFGAWKSLQDRFQSRES